MRVKLRAESRVRRRVFNLIAAAFAPWSVCWTCPTKTSVSLSNARFDELKGGLVPLLRALRSGIERYYKDKSFTVKVFVKYTRENDPEVLDKTYEFYGKAGFRRDLMISEPGVQGILNFLQETIPEAKNAKPSQFYDDRLVRQIDSGRQP